MWQSDETIFQRKSMFNINNLGYWDYVNHRVVSTRAGIIEGKLNGSFELLRKINDEGI